MNSCIKFNINIVNIVLTQMRYVAAYLLAVLGGKNNPTAKDLKGILSAVGVEANANNLDIVIKNLNGKSITDLIEEGSALLANVPSGGAVTSGVSGGGDTGDKVEEEKPKEKTPESESDSDEDMGLGLFD